MIKVLDAIKNITCPDCKTYPQGCRVCLKGKQLNQIQDLLYRIMVSERNRIKMDILSLDMKQITLDIAKDPNKKDLLKNVLYWIVDGKPVVKENPNGTKEKTKQKGTENKETSGPGS